MNTLEPIDRALIHATQEGLPLVPRPYAQIALDLGLHETEVRNRLSAMLASGLIRRIGAVPNHYRLGFVANGMSVWDIADECVDEIGKRIGAIEGVSHCYRRPRRLPLWPYNLFAMVHGQSREQVQAQVEHLAQIMGPACRAHDVLYSSAILKKTGFRMKEV